MTTWPCGPTRWIENGTLFVSVPFTWNLPALYSEFHQLNISYSKIMVGGPAMRLMPNYFDGLDWVGVGDSMPSVLQRVNPLATRTTTGCIRKCSFCAVPKTEGKLVELDGWPDLPIVCDNNLLATSQAHFDKVCDRLEKHKGVDFNQGLDARLLTQHHAERLSRIKGAIVRLALDDTSNCGLWEQAFQILQKAKVAKSRIRTYVLCGFKSNPTSAWGRCQFVESAGTMALPQWYHALDCMEYNAITKDHETYGWNKTERDRIMGYYYQHRGTAPKVTL